MMPNLFEILYKSYRYTKSHKYLWFFGFFLTWGGSLNFVRVLDFRTERWASSISNALSYVQQNPFFTIGSIAGALIIIFAGMSLGAISRAGIIWSGLHLERKERVTMNLSLGGARKAFWRVLGIGALINLASLFVFLWFAVPTLYIFSQGFVFRGIMITFLALLIFTPLVITLSMINIFAACFVVVYDLKYKNALRSATDLFVRYWDRTIGLMIILLIVYVFLFLISASLMGLLGGLAYLVAIMLKSVAMPLVIGTVSLFILLLSLVLITVNAILNVFNNLAWTLFFLKIVKAKRFPEEEAAVIETAV